MTEAIFQIHQLTEDQAAHACRTLLPSDRAETLISHWQRAFTDPTPEAAATLVVASVLSAGRQDPSATTVLSAARGLGGKEAGWALLLVGLAFEAIANAPILTDTIRRLVTEGLENTFEKFTQSIAHKESLEA